MSVAEPHSPPAPAESPAEEPASPAEEPATGAIARITSVEIENLRGIRTGKLEGLAPLTILTGPNGSGKSTVLDALDIGGSPNPAEAVRDCVLRRPQLPGGARWLFRYGREEHGRLNVKAAGRERRVIDLKKGQASDAGMFTVESFWVHWEMEADRPEEVAYEYASGSGTVFDGRESPRVVEPTRGPLPLSQVRDVLWVQGLAVGSLSPTPAHQLFSDVRIAGRRDQANQIARTLSPGVESLELLSHGDFPYLAVNRADGMVAAALIGDGAYAALRIGLEMLRIENGVALLEEPEAHLHPAAMVLVARAIVNAVRAGTQVVLTTHSIEFLDCLLDECEGEPASFLALFKVGLRDGELRSGRFDGDDVRFGRDQIAQDLR